MKKIMLINPRHHEFASVYDVPFPALMRLVSLTPKRFRVEVQEGTINQIKIKNGFDLVGITVMTPVAMKAYKIAEQYRKKGAKVILGGIHTSLLPDEAIKHADSIVVGEADAIWPKILKDFENGKLKKKYLVTKKTDMKNLPPLDMTPFLKNKKYLANSIQTTRGCPFKCEFCSVQVFNGNALRHQPIEDVVRDIKIIQSQQKGLGKKIFFITDDNLFIDKEYAKKFLKAITPLKMMWTAQAAISVGKDRELLKLAKKSGCFMLSIGFESVSQDSLTDIKKPFKIKDYEKCVREIRKQGILIHGLFVYGFDFDKSTIAKDTVEFCVKNKIENAQFTALSPYPGTGLHDRLKKEKRIVTYDWDKYDWRYITINPKSMTRKELAECLTYSYKNMYSLKNRIRIMKNLFLEGKIIQAMVVSFINSSVAKKVPNLCKDVMRDL